MPESRAAILALLVATTVAIPAGATTRRVPADYASLQDALSLGHTSQDTVLVAPGTYTGSFLFAQGATVLLSEGGAGLTVLDAGGDAPGMGGPVLRASFCNVRVRGFTVRGGRSGAGGGVYCKEANFRFEDCRFVENHAGQGGAGYVDDGSLTFVRCDLRRNRATSGNGGAVLADRFHALVRFEDCLVVENEASGLGGGIAADGNITNLELTRTTVAANRAAGGDNFALLNLGALVADHSVFASPTSTHNGLATASPGPALLTCSLMSALGGDGAEGFTFDAGVAGNVLTDPEFCDVPSGDFALAATSPAATAACGRMGARDVGCSVVPTRRTSWGAIKTRYH